MKALKACRAYASCVSQCCHATLCVWNWQQH